ncbi:hypothetical protein BZA77DRAFT_305854 [Pyronema omphalodes]|nr:hypothetical protein BZA77DRAFT_305854 [Pyronema omphalodes]
MKAIHLFISFILTVTAFQSDVNPDISHQNNVRDIPPPSLIHPPRILVNHHSKHSKILPKCYTAESRCGLGMRCCPGFKCLGVPRRCVPL